MIKPGEELVFPDPMEESLKGKCLKGDAFGVVIDFKNLGPLWFDLEGIAALINERTCYVLSPNGETDNAA